MNNTNVKPSNSLKLGVLLALVAGFWGAYTYTCRGGVFGNAVTGNVVLMGIHIAEGDINKVVRFFVPTFFFSLGVILTEALRKKFRRFTFTHWRNLIILLEILLIFIVGFIPLEHNHTAVIIISITSSMQISTFRQVRNCPCSTTMYTGNVKSCAENLFLFIDLKERIYLTNTLVYFSLISAFTLGAVLGAALTYRFGFKSIWFSTAGLLICFILMHSKKQLITTYNDL